MEDLKSQVACDESRRSFLYDDPRVVVETIHDEYHAEGVGDWTLVNTASSTDAIRHWRIHRMELDAASRIISQDEEEAPWQPGWRAMAEDALAPAMAPVVTWMRDLLDDLARLFGAAHGAEGTEAREQAWREINMRCRQLGISEDELTALVRGWVSAKVTSPRRMADDIINQVNRNVARERGEALMEDLVQGLALGADNAAIGVEDFTRATRQMRGKLRAAGREAMRAREEARRREAEAASEEEEKPPTRAAWIEV
jgi:hypothetical protein